MPSDVCYLSMPLFHSNALLAGWSVARRLRCGHGARHVLGVAAAVRSAPLRRDLHELRRQAAGLRAGHARSSPTTRDNPLRVAFGNEASDRDIAEFSRRFDCTVWDGFGSTEGAIIITREDGCPPGSLGRGFPGVGIYNPDTLAECPVAAFDDDGALTNADEAIGELVNTTGAGLFAGYYNDKDATDARLRNGMFWSGDLAYRDADGWIYFAGRSGDWLRVDGENMTTAPIERILQRLPAGQPGRGVRGTRRAGRRPGDGRDRAGGRRRADARRSSASFWPPSPTCRPKPGRATSGSPTSCRPRPPTRSSSGSSARRAAARRRPAVDAHRPRQQLHDR